MTRVRWPFPDPGGPARRRPMLVVTHAAPTPPTVVVLPGGVRVVDWDGTFTAPAVTGAAAVLLAGRQVAVIPAGGGQVFVYGPGPITLEWSPK